MVLASVPDLWRFQPHPEVWVLVAGLAGLYVYAARVVGPKAVPAGTPPITRRQGAAAAGALVALWLASDWPMHDIGEQYLYVVHMAQHTLLSLIVPPLALIATPRWLADLVLGSGRVREVVRILARPVVAGLLFMAMTLAVHWPLLVNASASNGLLHYAVHVGIVLTALVMWMPVCGPIAEWRIAIPGQMIYLFLMSIVPTVPGGWLTFAEGAVYSTYDIPQRAFGLTVQSDQQAAGVFMKLVAGGYLWAIITGLFFQWAFRHQREEEALARASRPAPAAGPDGELTFDEVSRAFEASEPAPEADASPRG